MVNIHSGHSDPLFDKCAHGSDIKARKWLTIGMLQWYNCSILDMIQPVLNVTCT